MIPMKRNPTIWYGLSISLATYTSRLSAAGRAQHEPLGGALQQYAGAKNKPALLSLLVPIQKASERSTLIKEMIESGDMAAMKAVRETARYLGIGIAGLVNGLDPLD